MTIAEWFSEHPQALAHLDTWVRARTAENGGTSARKYIHFLQREKEYPFRDHTALVGFIRRRHGDEWTQLSGTPEPAPVSEPSKPAKADFRRSDADVAKLERREDFLVTSAVANCWAEPGFLAACERWRDERQGVIVCNPIHYANPRTREEEEEESKGEWWDPALAPYMLSSELRPHPYLSIMPTKVQATSDNPLPPRLSGRTQARSAIFGHPQLSMRTVPTPQEKLPKILYSSGAITKKWYSDTLAGDMAEFHHTHAAVIAEIRGDRFHLREVTWDGEKFIDINRAYYADRIEQAGPPTALVMGDIQSGSDKVDQQVMRATFDGGLFDDTLPDNLILHDLADNLAVNPHEFRKQLSRAALARKAGGLNVEAEMQRVADWLNALPGDAQIVVVPSNHDEFLERWLEAGERNVLPENRKFYHQLCYEMLDEHERSGEFPLAIEVALQGRVRQPQIRFLKTDESFRIHGVEMGMHGHLGPNGARGTLRNLSRIGTRFITGHVHSPGIWQGGYAVGTSSLYRMGYNKGPSSWLHTHALLHENGRRQLIHIIGDYYCG